MLSLLPHSTELETSDSTVKMEFLWAELTVTAQQHKAQDRLSRWLHFRDHGHTHVYGASVSQVLAGVMIKRTEIFQRSTIAEGILVLHTPHTANTPVFTESRQTSHMRNDCFNSFSILLSSTASKYYIHSRKMKIQHNFYTTHRRCLSESKSSILLRISACFICRQTWHTVQAVHTCSAIHVVYITCIV